MAVPIVKGLQLSTYKAERLSNLPTGSSTFGSIDGTLGSEFDFLSKFTLNGSSTYFPAQGVAIAGTWQLEDGAKLVGIITQAKINILSGGIAIDTAVTSIGTINVFSGGEFSNAVVCDGGNININSGGSGSGVIQFLHSAIPYQDKRAYYNFHKNDIAIIALESPAGFKGEFLNWTKVDIINLKNTVVTSVANTQSQVTISYGNNENMSWALGNLQPDMKVVGVSDGHGGTNLQLFHV